jgi:hypothetical protein
MQSSMEERVAEEKREGPFYTGMYTHIDKVGGYSLVVPTDWRQVPLHKKIQGMMFSPYADDINTSLLAQKHILKFKVGVDDLILLRDSFEQGIKALPGAEIEKFEASYTDPIYVYDAVYTFLEGDARRKRWTRNIYWGEAQLVIVAQGRTPKIMITGCRCSLIPSRPVKYCRCLVLPFDAPTVRVNSCSLTMTGFTPVIIAG